MKLKTLCKLALAALEKAKTKQSKLFMPILIDNVDAQHPCNTAACVCGFMDLNTDVDKLPRVDQALLYFGEFLLTSLGKSIVESGWVYRKGAARESDSFTREELSTIPHLNKDKPSIDDAIEYIKIVLEKIGDDDL